MNRLSEKTKSAKNDKTEVEKPIGKSKNKTDESTSQRAAEKGHGTSAHGARAQGQLRKIELEAWSTEERPQKISKNKSETELKKDLSFEEAVNQRDTEKIDQACEQSEVNTRTEQGVSEHEAAAVNKRIASAAGLDDSEAEACSEQSEEGESWGQEDFNFGDGEHEEAAHGSAPRRRLKVKTNPRETGYTDRPLLKRAEFRIKKFQAQIKIKKRQAEMKAARKIAIELMSRQAPGGAFDEHENEVSEILEHPHPSHRIQSMHGGGDIIFCKNCSYWSARTKLRLLSEPCRGLKDGNKSKLRLLECGVQPGPDARVPPHLKIKHQRKGRRRSRW